MSLQISTAALERCVAKQMTVREIASALGCSPAMVHRRRRALGYRARIRRLSPLRAAILAAIRDGATTTEAIGERVGKTMAQTAVTMNHLAQLGHIKQVGKVPGNGGRHRFIWALAS